MSTGEVLLVAGAVLMAIAFAAVAIVLLRLLDTLRAVRQELDDLRAQTQPLLSDLQAATTDAERTMVAARADLERFDRVLGSAEAIGDAVSGTSRVARAAFSTPAIKAAGIATGTSRAVRRLRRRPVSLPPATRRR